MKQSTITSQITVLVVIALFLAVSTALAHAQASGTLAEFTLSEAEGFTAGYDLSWFTADGGGDTVDGGGYTLTGTAGQPDAGPALTNGGYTLIGGFWYGAVAAAAPQLPPIYLPLVLKS